MPDSYGVQAKNVHALITDLLARAPVITDGAWGTELQARGLPNGACPDEWNLSEPARVTEVAVAYVAAGSRVILTNTFGANAFRLKEYGLEKQVREINRRGVEISRQAAGRKAKVFASVGPSGQLLLMGQVTPDDLQAAFAEQMEALAAAGADALLCETITDLAEGKIMVAAARATGLPVVASASFDTGKDLDRTMMGATPEQAAAELLAAGADVVGANCGQSIATYLPLCQRLHQAAGGPVWVKANAGRPRVEQGKTVFVTTPDDFAAAAPALVAAGAGFIGGCCGTSPAFIKALSGLLAAKKKARGAQSGKGK